LFSNYRIVRNFLLGFPSILGLISCRIGRPYTNNSKKANDGDHPTKLFPNGPTPVMESKKVREVHAMVRNYLNKEDDGQSSSSGNWPGFVYLLEQSLEGKIPARTTP